jgi:SLT domain-containing protein
VLALWSVAAMAIAVSRGLLKVIPLTWITRAAAAAMLILAGASRAAAIW